MIGSNQDLRCDAGMSQLWPALDTPLLPDSTDPSDDRLPRELSRQIRSSTWKTSLPPAMLPTRAGIQGKAMSKIDVHMLVLGTERPDWKAQAIASIPTDICTLRIVDGIPGHIGRARVRAYKLGDAEFVSSLDPDDWVEPNTFELCLDFLERHPRCPGVVSLEIVHDYFKRRTYMTRNKHGLKVYRRKWLETRYFEMEDDPAVSTGIRTSSRAEVLQLPIMGLHWRKYPSEAFLLRKQLGLHRDQPRDVDLFWQ